jgi:hypothetical protein
VRDGICILCSFHAGSIRHIVVVLEVHDKMNWNDLCADSIRKDRIGAEAKYGIRIGQTEIYCVTCGKKWDFTGHNGCPGKIAHPHTLLADKHATKPVE